MKYLYIFIFSVIASVCWGQALRSDIQAVVDSIAKSNRITGAFIYYERTPSKQHKRFEILDASATNSELKHLLTHQSPAVRCAAFAAFCKRNPIEAQNYLMPALYNKETVETLDGCIGGTRKVADVFLESFSIGLLDLDSTEWATTKPKIVQLDSLILHDPNIQMEYKSGRIRSLEPNSANYKLIRRLAVDKIEPYAVVTLAKYQKEEDKQIIIDWLKDESHQYYGIWAAREFPDVVFFPYLKQIFKKEWRDRYYSYSTWRVLYQALAQYPDRIETIKMFDKTIRVKNKFRKRTLGKYLLIAITKYPNPQLEPYKDKIKISRADADFLETEMHIED